MDLFFDNEFRALIPPLQPEERILLEAGLKAEGNRVPITIWKEKGLMLDGHNRYDICTNSHIPLKPAEELSFPDRESAKIWIIENQLARRNISAYSRIGLNKAKAEIIARREEGKSNQQIRKGKQPGSTTLSLSDKVVNTQKEIAKAAKVSTGMVAMYDVIEKKGTPEQKAKLTKSDANTSIKSVYKEIKSEEKAKERENKINNFKSSLVKIPHDNHVKFCLEDFRNSTIADNTIDHIFTDPPYAAKYLSLWNDLSSFAARILKPGGLCITYSGTYHLPEYINRLSEHLTYYWQFILLHNGCWQRMDARALSTGYKPILVFAKPPVGKLLTDTFDIIEGTGREKDMHEWAQALGEAEDILKRLTHEGQTIVDPFAGSGTIAMACKNTNRLNISYETDENYYNAALVRLNSG